MASLLEEMEAAFRADQDRLNAETEAMKLDVHKLNEDRQAQVAKDMEKHEAAAKANAEESKAMANPAPGEPAPSEEADLGLE